MRTPDPRSSEPKIEIRKPSESDVPALVAIGARTFAETFVGMQYYTQEIVDEYNAATFTEAAITADLRDDKIAYLLMSVDGKACGYAKLVERAPADCVGDRHAIYLQRIYFLLGHQRLGLGTRLLDAVYDEAKRRGYEWLWLSVWEYNLPAVTFYAKHGYEPVGEWDWAFEVRGQRYVDRDRVMIKSLK